MQSCMTSSSLVLAVSMLLKRFTRASVVRSMLVFGVVNDGIGMKGSRRTRWVPHPPVKDYLVSAAVKRVHGYCLAAGSHVGKHDHEGTCVIGGDGVGIAG